MLRHFSRNVFFFQIFELGNIFENFDQKVPNNAKKLIGQNFQKYCLIQKSEKLFLELCLYMIFRQF